MNDNRPKTSPKSAKPGVSRQSAASASARRPAASRPATSKAAASKAPASKAAGARTAGPKLLSGGNPQIAKGTGNASVQAYLDAMPGWKQDIGRRLDALIVEAVPDVQKAVKWNSPFYGIEGQGWFLSFHCFTKYVKVTFFRGTSLRPVPPGVSKHNEVRYLDLPEGPFDEAQFINWVHQARHLPGVPL